uniref:Uncharacterized protein n=1 Tax=Sphaerodactylus townsendi TaxID=933632 RepID=A0ACB8EI81_9SAUR
MKNCSGSGIKVRLCIKVFIFPRRLDFSTKVWSLSVIEVQEAFRMVDQTRNGSIPVLPYASIIYEFHADEFPFTGGPWSTPSERVLPKVLLGSSCGEVKISAAHRKLVFM